MRSSLDSTPYTYVVHADWSIRASGRWRAHAILLDGVWRIHAARPVGDPAALISDILSEAEAVGAGGGVFLGVDLPIGLPRRWAERAGVADFMAVLPEFGGGKWADFFTPARTPEEISLRRPFYPAGVGGRRQQHLIDGLGFGSMDALRRRADFAANGKRSGAPMFWTLGGAQVGKSALDFWRGALQPALAAGTAAVWPFAGALAALSRVGRVVVAETYPGEAYHWFGLGVASSKFSKRRLSDRQADAPRLLQAGEDIGAVFDPAAAAQIREGFPSDDAFDAMVGVLAALAVVTGRRQAGAPADDPLVQRVEGWILGRTAAPPGNPLIPK